MTAAVWIRGFFDDDYGVRSQDMNWFLGGQEDPGRKERVKLELAAGNQGQCDSR